MEHSGTRRIAEGLLSIETVDYEEGKDDVQVSSMRGIPGVKGKDQGKRQ